jgi:hypothetical protein
MTLYRVLGTTGERVVHDDDAVVGADGGDVMEVGQHLFAAVVGVNEH